MDAAPKICTGIMTKSSCKPCRSLRKCLIYEYEDFLRDIRKHECCRAFVVAVILGIILSIAIGVLGILYDKNQLIYVGVLAVGITSTYPIILYALIISIGFCLKRCQPPVRILRV